MNLIQLIYFQRLKKRLCNIIQAFIDLKIFNSAVKNVTFDLHPKVHFKLNGFINHLYSLFEKYITQNMDKEILHNFLCFYIYHQVGNNNLLWGRIETEVDLSSKRNLIEFNHQKRNFYYAFLNQIKELDNYNTQLRIILRNTL